MGDRTVDSLLRLRVPVVLGFLALVACSASLLPDLPLELGIDKLLEPNRDELERVEEFYEAFRPDLDDAIVVLTFPHQLDRAALDEIERVGREIAGFPEVQDVTSLANVRVVSSSGLPLPRAFPATVDDQAVVEAAQQHPLLRRTLLSGDGRSTVIRIRAAREPSATFDPHGFDPDAFFDRLLEEVPQLPSEDVEARILGGGLVVRTLHGHMLRDIVRTIGLELLFFAVLLPFVFRTARGSLLPLLVVAGSIVLNFGWMAFLGFPLTIIDIAVPGLVVIIGLCDAIHLVHRFEEAFAQTHDKMAAIRTSLLTVGRACFHTSFTTAIGFLSLAVTQHDTVVAFGIKAATCVVVTFLVVVTVVPAGLALWPARRALPPRRVQLPGLRWGRPRLTFAVVVGVLFLAGLGVARINVDSHWLEELPSEDPVVEDIAWFEEQFSGILQLEALVEGDLLDADAFRAVETFQRELVKEDGISRSEAYTMWIREALGNPEEPIDRRRIESGSRRLEAAGDAFPLHMTDSEFRKGRLVFAITDVGAKRLLELRDRMAALAADLPPTVTIEPQGYTLMASRSTQTVIRAMSESLLVSVLSITVFICLIYRSIRIGLVSLVPNVMPLFIALGLSGWLGIDLRIGGALIYCLGLGLAVDDTIHIISRYLQEKRSRPDSDADTALQVALASSGRALVTTSIILGTGTLCHLVSSFRTLNEVGILLFTVVVTALAADLWVLPHLLARRRTSP